MRRGLPQVALVILAAVSLGAGIYALTGNRFAAAWIGVSVFCWLAVVAP